MHSVVVNKKVKILDRYGVLDFVPVGICIFNHDYIVQFWNRCLSHWTCIPSDEIRGKSLLEQSPFFSNPGFIERTRNIFTGGPPVLFSSQLHKNMIPCKLTDGSTMIQKAVVSAIPLEGAKNSYHALMVIENVTALSRKVSEYRRLRNQAMGEVTHRKEIEVALRKSNEALREHQLVKLKQERLKVLLEMAGATAHELNQPLMTLLGNIELAHLVDDVPPELESRLKHIETSAKRMADIVAKIQKIRRYETKKYLDDSSIIDLNESSL